jgi:Sulfotransferase domain
MSDQMRLANFIIGGTDKAGTTSVFTYLSQHPQVCAASAKETNFFRHDFTGDLPRDLLKYGAHFRRCTSSVPVIMEASPAYLAEAPVVAPRMAQLLPDVKLLFILRNPIDRFYSSYKFHLGKLNIPASISIEEYVNKCLAYERDAANAGELGINEWCLKALRIGYYVDSLSPFFDNFPRQNIHVMFFDELERDARQFMSDLSAFLRIDAAFWDRYQFTKENVTFSVRNKSLHRLAMLINRKGEQFLRRRPTLKRTLTGFYYRLTGAQQGYAPMPPTVRGLLYDYYLPGNRALTRLLHQEIPGSWSSASPRN